MKWNVYGVLVAGESLRRSEKEKINIFYELEKTLNSKSIAIQPENRAVRAAKGIEEFIIYDFEARAAAAQCESENNATEKWRIEQFQARFRLCYPMIWLS